MFLSEEEANKRLNSSKNVLTSIKKDGDSRSGEVHENEPLLIPVDELVPEDQTCASAQGVLEAPDGKFLKKLLGMNVSTGRKKGQVEMPKEMQAACATTAQIAGTQRAASAFDVSYHHADELKHGYTNQAARYDDAQDPDKDLVKIINKQKTDVRNLAFEKLTKALGLMSDAKLETLVDPVKIARVAKDLSTVVDKVLPKDAVQLGGVHFHVWRPEMRTEDTYETISVGGQR